MPEITIRELARRLNATFEEGGATGECCVRGVNAVVSAGADEVTFIKSGRHISAARRSQAAAVITQKAIDNFDKPQLLVDDVDRALITTLEFFAPPLIPVATGVHPSAVLAADVQIEEDVHIGAHVVIEEGVQVGKGTIIASGCRIGQGCRIGHHTRLDCNVVVYHQCVIGNHVLIQANSTVGSIGFGYATIDGQLHLVPHNGGVIIEDFVEVGANCCIDRAKFTNTIVGAGTKMDNMVQVGHNVIIGKCCLIAAQTGIAGSAQLGDGVMLAGQSGVADNLVVADGTMVGAKAGVMKSTTKPGQKLLWMPAMEQKEALRILAELYRLPKNMKRMKELAERWEAFDVPKDNQG